MKRAIAILLASVVFCCCAASATDIEILLKPNTECINYGLNELPVATYADAENRVYVSLEDLMLALNGTYTLEDGKITISLDRDNLPSAMAEHETVAEPSTSWAYVEYYFQDTFGFSTEEMFSAELLLLIDKAIQKDVDTDALLEALDEMTSSGGVVHRKLDELIK